MAYYHYTNIDGKLSRVYAITVFNPLIDRATRYTIQLDTTIYPRSIVAFPDRISALQMQEGKISIEPYFMRLKNFLIKHEDCAYFRNNLVSLTISIERQQTYSRHVLELKGR